MAEFQDFPAKFIDIENRVASEWKFPMISMADFRVIHYTTFLYAECPCRVKPTSHVILMLVLVLSMRGVKRHNSRVMRLGLMKVRY